MKKAKVTFYNSLCILMLTLVLSGCGFKLRSTQPLPAELHDLYIIADNIERPMQADLTAALKAHGVTLVEHAAQAAFTIELLNSELKQTLMNMNPDGQIRNYLIRYTLHYQVLNKAGRIILPPHVIVITRNYTLTSKQLLNESSNFSQLQQSVYQDAINQLLERLHTTQFKNHLISHHAA